MLFPSFILRPLNPLLPPYVTQQTTMTTATTSWCCHCNFSCCRLQFLLSNLKSADFEWVIPKSENTCMLQGLIILIFSYILHSSLVVFCAKELSPTYYSIIIFLATSTLLDYDSLPSPTIKSIYRALALQKLCHRTHTHTLHIQRFIYILCAIFNCSFLQHLLLLTRHRYAGRQGKGCLRSEMLEEETETLTTKISRVFLFYFLFFFFLFCVGSWCSLVSNVSYTR